MNAPLNGTMASNKPGRRRSIGVTPSGVTSSTCVAARLHRSDDDRGPAAEPCLVTAEHRKRIVARARGHGVEHVVARGSGAAHSKILLFRLRHGYGETGGQR